VVPRVVLTDEQRRQFEGERNAAIIERLRWGMAAGIVLCLVMAAIVPGQFPTLSLKFTVLPAVGTALGFGLAYAITFAPAVQRHANALVTALAMLSAAAIGFACSGSGGYDAPTYTATYLIWVFGAVVIPLRVGVLLFHAVTMTGIVAVLIFTLAPHVGSSPVALMFSLGVAGFCVLGAYLRDRAMEREFLARMRLDGMNVELERRVQEQVVEIVTHAKEIDALNAQLKLKVQERSRELARALARLERHNSEITLQLDQVLGGRVRIVRPIGAGGMGAVYLGDDLVTNKRVAVKLMHGSHAADRALLQRFMAEAEAAAAITDEAIIKTLHIDVTEDGRLYQLMEYVHGVTLARRLARGAIGAAAAARIGATAARALDAAHRAGVIHRDIKPNNLILCTTPPGVRILDFGVSKLAGRAPDDPRSDSLTKSNQVIGTPLYMSPEQIRDSAHVTPASDVYSLGIVLYELLAGTTPFGGAASTAAVYVAHLSDEPVPLLNRVPDAPAAYAALVMACLAKKPERRPDIERIGTDLTHIANELQAPATHVAVRGEINELLDTDVDDMAGAPTLREKAGG
jgi:serine/threonine-protein kinase